MEYAVQTTIGPKLHCESKHLRTGKTFTTDLPPAIGGTGESFAPAEALAATLCSCMLSMLQFSAKSRGLAIDHATASAVPVEKNNRIVEMHVKMTVPGDLSAQDQAFLEQAVSHCPVKNALNPSVDVIVIWEWL